MLRGALKFLFNLALLTETKFDVPRYFSDVKNNCVDVDVAVIYSSGIRVRVRGPKGLS